MEIISLPRRLGVMRVALAVMALLLVVLMPLPGFEPKNGFEEFRSVVVPALSPILFMVVMLDVLMSKVHMIDAEESRKMKFRFIIRFELIVALVLMLSWLPFFISVSA